jgi:hypothetical protein
LRGLSERDAALQFSRLLQISGPYPLRPTSGLVEQQRILELADCFCVSVYAYAIAQAIM